jgi:hypothetical protein
VRVWASQVRSDGDNSVLKSEIGSPWAVTCRRVTASRSGHRRVTLSLRRPASSSLEKYNFGRVGRVAINRVRVMAGEDQGLLKVS